MSIGEEGELIYLLACFLLTREMHFILVVLKTKREIRIEKWNWNRYLMYVSLFFVLLTNLL